MPSKTTLLLPYTAYPEPSRFVAFAHALRGRSSEKRAANSSHEALHHPSAQIALFGMGSDVLMRADQPLTVFAPVNDVALEQIDEGSLLLLGHDAAQNPVLAARTKEPEATLPLDYIAVGLRALYMAQEISTVDLSNLGYAHALLCWNENTRFCGRCGGATIATDGGTKRVCDQCQKEHFPRSDPVAIMLITHQNQCLLGRTPNFAAGMYSCLAGFVEQGETLEDAVRRETLEEAGVLVGKVAYHASQPWPFPHSLMLGCIGEALDPTLNIDHEEMDDCSWFSREDVRLMFAGTHPSGKSIPPGGAIATHLIRAWLEAD